MPSIEVGPPTPVPDISGMDQAAVVEAMTMWFFENFEDPVESLPWDEGAYVWIWGGPYYAQEELEHAFGGVATEAAIAAAVARVEADGCMWTPSDARMLPSED
jgi:hypothetical protein